jgi:hypothetical protein
MTITNGILGHCACGYACYAVEFVPEEGSQSLICPQCHRDTWMQLDMAQFLGGRPPQLLLGSPIQSKDIDKNLASLKRCTSTLIKLMNPPPDKEGECRMDIEYRWYRVLDAKYRVGDQDFNQKRCGLAGQVTAALWPIIPAHPGYVRLASWGFDPELAARLQDCFERAPIIAWLFEPNGPFPIADNDQGVGRPAVWAARRPDGSIFMPYDEGSLIDPGTFESEADFFKHLADCLPSIATLMSGNAAGE